MKALCFLIPMLLYITKFICSHHLNVGTVLFTKSHLHKKCWTESEIKLLSARQIMQGVLPDPDFIDITKTGTITVLLEYFQSCFEAISQSPCRTDHHLMFLALADALGGYLRSYILPLTRQAFYAGHIKYFEARKVYQFYEELKEFLKTDGVGWARPRMCTMNSKVKPLEISMKDCETACSQLYLRGEADMEICRSVQSNKHDICTTELPACPVDESEFDEKRRLIDVIEGLRNRKDFTPYSGSASNMAARIGLHRQSMQKIEKIRKSARHRKDRVQFSVANSTGCGKYDRLNVNNFPPNTFRRAKSLRKRNACCRKKPPKSEKCRKKTLIVPLPILDDPFCPTAIGLPFRARPLRNLDSPHSICILVRYYMTVIKCIVSKSSNKCDLCYFNAQFKSWLSSNVLPHLNDEQWYPAFGGVLRIEETINSFGKDGSIKCKSSCSSEIGYMFSKGYGFEETDYANADTGNEECQDMIPPCTRKQSRTYLTLGIAAIILVWIIALWYCICCHCSNPNCEEETGQETSRAPAESKKKVNPNNSFIVQCLIKFFRRGEEEKKEDFDPTKEKVNYNVYYGDVTPVSDAEGSHRALPRGRSIADEYRAECTDDHRRRNINNRETIVLPAQINPKTTEMPMEYNTFWPFADYRDEADLGKQHPDKGLRFLFDRKTPLIKMRREREQFRTLWKREKTAARTSESCEGLSPQKGKSLQGRGKRKADVLSRSSYSESEGSHGRRVIFLRRSRSDFDCPNSYRYSYSSSSASYSSSQAENDIPMDLFGHVAACHNSFAKKPRTEERQKPQTESESERGLTSSSTSEESFSSVKRVSK